MTKKNLFKLILMVTAFYIGAVIIGIWVHDSDNTVTKSNYALFKDLIPLIIAIPAAYLGFCFQRRSSYQQALRQLWSDLIASTQRAIQYTHLEKPSEKEYRETLVSLSISIEEVRGVYRNLKESNRSNGLYPFQSLKEIHGIISDLGLDNADKKNADDPDKKNPGLTPTEAREKILFNWKNIRKTFLAEFDRPEPTVFDSPYFKKQKNKFM